MATQTVGLTEQPACNSVLAIGVQDGFKAA